MSNVTSQVFDSSQIAIYTRSAVDGAGAEAKLAKCKERCLALWGGHGEVFDDTGISGLDPDRPALASLLLKASVGLVKIVVVHDLDAIARNFGLSIKIFGLMAAAGLQVEVVEKILPGRNAVTSVEEASFLLVERTKVGRERAKLKHKEAKAAKFAPSKAKH